MNPRKPVLLMILDGWGLRTMEHGNAVVQAHTPNYDRWTTERERTVLDASEEAVGLIPDQMGNSEVGHLNLGAGRVVYQDISRINNAIRNSSFFKHDILNALVEDHQRVHLVGLLGPGGVHAHDDHLYALLRFLDGQEGVRPILHIITDGRDTPPDSAASFLTSLRGYIAENDLEVDIATLSGRYYAMDRDKRWERTTKAYQAMVNQEGNTAATPEEAIEASHAEDVSDEFIVPTVIGEDDTLAIQAGDGIIFYNFRADRMRQIVRLFTGQPFEDRPEVPTLDDLGLVTMTTYADDLAVQVLYPLEVVQRPLAQILAEEGRTQFHIAETEKYPHVTYFFNGRTETPFDGEERKIIPSPKVATYDLQPEMSAHKVTETILERIATHDDDFLLLNFANPDMVGHTGSLEAAIKACEVVDEYAGRVVEAIVEKGGAAIVTADHGNADRMVDEFSGGAHTYHTTNPVPMFIITDGYVGQRPRGRLADVAPTILHLLGIPKPPEMTGRTMIITP